MPEPSSPPIVKVLMREGAAAYERGDWAAAERVFRRCLDLAPGNPLFLHNLGVVAHRLNRPADAVALLLKAAENGADERTWLLLAQILQSTGQDDQAFNWLARILQANPAHAAAALASGEIKDRMGDKPGAREFYRRAHQADPANIAAGQKFATAMWDRDPQQAVAVTTRVLVAVGGNPTARAQVLETLASQSEWWERIRRGLSADHADSLDELFFTYAGDRLAEYETINARLLAANANDSAARVRLGLARFCDGDRHGAETLFRAASDRTAGTIYDTIRFSQQFHDHLRGLADEDIVGSIPTRVDVTPLVPDAAGVLYLACDAAYLRSFALPMLCSLAENSPRTPVHLHIFDLPEAQISGLTAFCEFLAPLRFAVSVESPGFDGAPSMEARCYYHAVRFIRFHEHMRLYKCPLWMADVDALVNRDLSGLFAMIYGRDIAMRVRPGRLEPWNQFNASVVGAGTSERALAYYRQVAAYVADFHREGGLQWGIDQLAMYAVFTDLADAAAEPSVALLGAHAVDYGHRAEGFIWCNSGAKKFQHLLRVESPDKMQAADFEGNRYVAAFECYWQTSREVADRVGWEIERGRGPQHAP